MRLSSFIVVTLFAAALHAAEKPEKPAHVPAGYSLVYTQDFQTGGDELLNQFVFGDAASWRIATEGANRFLEQHQMGKYQPKHRSPFNIALVQGHAFSDFVFEADMQQTSKEYGHRDMVVLFAFKDAEHFYYTHMATKTDDHAHNIFIVNDAPRTKISTKTTSGIDWAQTWKPVRVERSGGTVNVYFDNQLIQSASDGTFDWGHIGFGTFDDTGRIDNIRIWAPSARNSNLEALKNYPPPAKPAKQPPKQK